MLHLPTLMLMDAALLMFMTAVLFAAWRFNPRVPGVGLWVLSYVCFSVGILLLVGRAALSPWMSIVAANTIIALGNFLTLAGFRRYAGRPGPDRRLALAVLLGIAAFLAYYSFVDPNYTARVVGFCGTVAVILGFCARDAFRVSEARHPARIFFGAVVSAHVAYYLFRVASGIAGLQEFTIDGQPTGLALAVGFEAVVIGVLIALAVILLAAEHLSENLRKLSERDPLTEVFNRRAFMTLFDKAVSRTRRDGTPLALLALDLDHFKKINDTRGHAAGDAVLRHFVRLAEKNLRAEDVLGRIGGEEFAVFLPGTPVEGARHIAERLRSECAQAEVLHDGAPIRFTVSIGVSTAKPDTTAADLMQRADDALYAAKKAGRDRVEVEEGKAG